MYLEESARLSKEHSEVGKQINQIDDFFKRAGPTADVTVEDIVEDTSIDETKVQYILGLLEQAGALALTTEISCKHSEQTFPAGRQPNGDVGECVLCGGVESPENCHKVDRYRIVGTKAATVDNAISAEVEGLWAIHRADYRKPVGDIIFVHGLDGAFDKTWKSTTGFEWPFRLGEKHANWNVWSCQLNTSSIKSRNKAMSVFDLARQQISRMLLGDLGVRPIVFICHSLGGIVVKQCIRLCNESNDAREKQLVQNVKGIMFCSTPHLGSQLAVIRKIPGVPLLTTRLVAELSNDDSQLTGLNNAFRAWVSREKIVVYALVETQSTRKRMPIVAAMVSWSKRLEGFVERFPVIRDIVWPSVGIVVAEHSADPGAAGVKVFPIDADHLGIAKPPDASSEIFQLSSALIDEVESRSS